MDAPPPDGAFDGSHECVFVAAPDLGGRLVGRRHTASYYESSASAGVSTCDIVLGWGLGHELYDFDAIGWEHGYGDYVMRPDHATLRPMSWKPGASIVIADFVTPEGVDVEFAPRTVLRRQVTRARERGFEPLVASELEFTVLAEPREQIAKQGYALGTPYRETLHPELVEAVGLDHELLGQIMRDLEAARVPVQTAKTEYAPGQFEITLTPGSPLDMADQHALFKLGVRDICRLHGLSATFMAIWDASLGGSSCHLHISLSDADGVALFAESREEALRAFIGGVQRYMRDVFLLWAPYENSFRRFKDGTFAPSSASWGGDNRTTALRITGRGNSRHLENRIPGADVNPYLAHAALLAAGLAGIDERIEPVGDFVTGNAYAKDGLPTLPSSLGEALDAFRSSSFAKESFGEAVVAHIANFAQKELDASRYVVTDWERRRLFDI